MGHIFQYIQPFWYNIKTLILYKWEGRGGGHRVWNANQVICLKPFNWRVIAKITKLIRNLTCLFQFPHFILLSKLTWLFSLFEKITVKVSICWLPVNKPVHITNHSNKLTFKIITCQKALATLVTWWVKFDIFMRCWTCPSIMFGYCCGPIWYSLNPLWQCKN